MKKVCVCVFLGGVGWNEQLALQNELWLSCSLKVDMNMNLDGSKTVHLAHMNSVEPHNSELDYTQRGKHT